MAAPHVMTATSKIQWPGRVPGHWGYCQYFKFFKRKLGLPESPSGLGESQANEATANIKFLKGHWPSRKSQWPGRVPGHWGYCQYLKFSKGHWAFGEVPVAWESPGPLRLLPIFQIFKRSPGPRESPSCLGESRATEANANIKCLKGHWAFGKVPVA